ncbi:MAG: hypothetical protein WC812_01920 [Candidatus Pacearchaeota archaeon]|jgi:predicted nucleic acid-binding Zn ribbon protein
MDKRCIICNTLIEEDEDFCKTCVAVLRKKYPNKKKLEEILKWHKSQAELNKED